MLRWFYSFHCRVLWGMVNNHASCMVMGVSMSAFYPPLVSPILSSFSILEEFLLYQTFEEAGEFALLAIAIIFSNVMKGLKLQRRNSWISLIFEGLWILSKLTKVFNYHLLSYYVEDRNTCLLCLANPTFVLLHNWVWGCLKTRCLGKGFNPRKKVVIGWRKLHNEKFHNLYTWPNIVTMIKLWVKWEMHIRLLSRNLNIEIT